MQNPGMVAEQAESKIPLHFGIPHSKTQLILLTNLLEIHTHFARSTRIQRKSNPSWLCKSFHIFLKLYIYSLIVFSFSVFARYPENLVGFSFENSIFYAMICSFKQSVTTTINGSDLFLQKRSSAASIRRSSLLLPFLHKPERLTLSVSKPLHPSSVENLSLKAWRHSIKCDCARPTRRLTNRNRWSWRWAWAILVSGEELVIASGGRSHWELWEERALFFYHYIKHWVATVLATQGRTCKIGHLLWCVFW